MKSLRKIILLICFMQSGFGAPIQWTSASGGNDHYYEFIPAQGQSWDDANASASSMTYLGLSGYLVTILSSAENDFVRPLASGSQPLELFWAGATDRDVEGVWRWVGGPDAGATTTFTNWGPTEPNNVGGIENYLQILSTSGGWNDVPNAGLGQSSGYIVEFGGTTSVPEPKAQLLVMVSCGVVLAFSKLIRPSNCLRPGKKSGYVVR